MQTCTREIVIFLLAAGRGWYGCQRRLSPLPGSVSCHAIVTDDQGAVSWSMDTGVGGLTSGLRVLSALSIAGGSLEVTRSQVVFHFHFYFHFYFLLCHRGEERLQETGWQRQSPTLVLRAHSAELHNPP